MLVHSSIWNVLHEKRYTAALNVMFFIAPILVVSDPTLTLSGPCPKSTHGLQLHCVTFPCSLKLPRVSVFLNPLTFNPRHPVCNLPLTSYGWSNRRCWTFTSVATVKVIFSLRSPGTTQRHTHANTESLSNTIHNHNLKFFGTSSCCFNISIMNHGGKSQDPGLTLTAQRSRARL